MVFRFRECLSDTLFPTSESEEEEDDVDFAESMFRAFKKGLYMVYLGVWACAIMYTIYNVSQSLGKYLEKPVRTQITTYRSENGSMPFPTISICNLNKVNKSYMDQHENLAHVWSVVSNPWGYPLANWSEKPFELYKNLTYHDIYQYSSSWEQTAVACNHAGVRYCDTLHFSRENIVSQDFGPTGKCFRFNPNGVIRSKAGDYGSIYLRLNVNRREYLVLDEVLFTVAIHHHTQYSVTRNTGIQISPGFKYKIGVRAVEREELDLSRGGKCDASRKTNSYGAYDLESCHMECRDKILEKRCGCVLWLPPHNIHGYRRCTLQETYECGFKAYYEFVVDESDVDHVRNGQDCDCPVPCKNTIYSLQTTTTALSKEWAQRKANSEGKTFNYTATDFLENNVIIEVFFADMYVDKVAQIPAYDFWNFLADVGGMMGLLLGASVFTLLEAATKISKKVYQHSRKKD
ncbi:hypothetical protein ACHWQZ_G016635 [Mnemiopsis leidyi]